MRKYDFSKVYAGLKDFQRATVDYVFDHMYGASGQSRFLVADEVGLGKTLVARGLIARTIEHLRERGVKRIDVVYVCSNADIARQNVQRLNVTQQRDFALPGRITLLPLHLQDLAKNELNFVSFTPGTSFDLKSNLGISTERVLLYRLLRRAWGAKALSGTGTLHLLRGRSHLGSFKYEVSCVSDHSINDDLARRFERALGRRPDLRQRFEELRGPFARLRRPTPPDDLRHLQAQLIGDLRDLLAASCVRALEPDLVILDEFQRFRHILHGHSEAAELARQLFDYRDHLGERVRVLLLSATPYKMYTLADEEADDHYSDFVETLRFLMGDDEAEAFSSELATFRHALLHLPSTGIEAVLTVRAQIEERLRTVMVRTERLAVTENRSGMLNECESPALQLDARDIHGFVALDSLARHLRVGDVLEYWKSAPYLLNFMEQYKLANAVTAAEEAGERLPVDASSLLPWGDVEAYRRVDPGNARLRSLLAQTVDQQMWRLLWLPPSLSYYDLATPFSQVRGLTKRLVFSAWAVAPKAIAALLSYEAERQMVRSFSRHRINTPEARKKAKPLLRFAYADDRPTGMPVFALLYPSTTLARLVDPLALVREVGAAPAAVIRRAEAEIGDALSPLLEEARQEGPADEAWYWASSVLLDDDAWLARPTTPEAWTGGEADEAGSRWRDHVAHAGAVDVRTLGRPPDDLAKTLALVGLGGPGVTALRALSRATGDAGAIAQEGVRDAAARVAWALRSLFNLPEATALVRGLKLTGSPDDPYWRQVLLYCFNGGLQATLDEYAHLLVEWLGLIDKKSETIASEVATAMHDSIALRTATYSVKNLESDNGQIRSEPHRMRGRFALRFGEERGEEERDVHRPHLVRQAFNSPFWPFVLATTSVGQEGLDFHLYCHAIVHWNLPANPVDLEQREGRVHRYKGHAVRKNLAEMYRRTALQTDGDPWAAVFEEATRRRPEGTSDIVPSWVFATKNGARIERYVPILPFSKDAERLRSLKRSLAAYRLAFGQPRQEDLIAFLSSRLSAEELARALEELRIDLAPPRSSKQPSQDRAAALEVNWRDA